MPKMKTNSGAKKRFKVTASGKIKRKHAYKSHILTKKETDQKKRLGKFAIVSDTDVKRVKKLLAM
jgi:large subunit ribosomal protein L35